MMLNELKNMRVYAGRNPLVAALALSLLIHLFGYVTWQVGRQFNWWDQRSSWLLALVEKVLHSPTRPKAPFPAKAVEEARLRELPVTFIEVDPAAVATEAPKNPEFYSTRNTRASNPDPVVDTIQPKIDGRQDKVPRLMDNDRPNPVPLQPAKPEPAEPTPPKPKGGEVPGDFALARKRDPAPPSDGQVDIGLGEAKTPPKPRPRTVAEAKAQRAMLTGEKMKQDGGVQQRGPFSVNAIVTGFSEYDAEFIAAVQQRWYSLLEQHTGNLRSGKVVLEFRLHYDGRVSNMKFGDNGVGDVLGLICQSAILDPSPYRPWPSDMRREIGANHRDVKFTFYYN